MQAHGPAATGTRLRWLAILLSCLVVISLASAARSSRLPKHPLRSVVAVAASTVEAPHGARHAADSDLTVAPADAAARFVAFATPDSSQDVSSRTAEAPQIRGPPEQALA